MSPSKQTRRELLRRMSALSCVGAASSTFGLQLATMGAAAAQTAPASYHALVCIFMFGGNDAHNMVLATDTDSWGRYFAARNTGSAPIAFKARKQRWFMPSNAGTATRPTPRPSNRCRVQRGLPSPRNSCQRKDCRRRRRFAATNVPPWRNTVLAANARKLALIALIPRPGAWAAADASIPRARQSRTPAANRIRFCACQRTAKSMSESYDTTPGVDQAKIAPPDADQPPPGKEEAGKAR